MNPKPISARAAAFQWLDAILHEKRTLDDALHAAPWHGHPQDGKFAQMLVLTVLRHLGQLDVLLAQYLKEPLPTKRRRVMHALRLGAAQLVILGTPAHAAVNEAVALVKKGKDGGLSGLVNAVLQRIAREQPSLPDAAQNLPLPIRARWEAWYGAQAVQQIAALAATRPPLDIAQAEPMEGAARLDTWMQRLPADHDAVESLAGYDAGAFFVQDLAASYPARLLGDVQGKAVLDICAAPGGKTMQLVRAGAKVTALDQSASRMRRFAENMRRMNMQPEQVVADAMVCNTLQLHDAVLLDAPCSATGTWRRHPEVLAITDLGTIPALAKQQRDLMSRVWQWVKPGGMMVYCVCSLEREEGEAQAEWFPTRHADAALVPVDAAATEIPAICITPEGYLRTLPSHHAEHGGMDGFFAVCFRET